MFAVLGITGKVGGAVARSLLVAGQPVRAIVRSQEKGYGWAERGCEVCVADLDDQESLVTAFHASRGVFIMLPSNFDQADGFPETISMVKSIRHALEATRPQRVVCLSTIGAQATQSNLLSKLGIMERSLSVLPVPVTFLRAAWFMENAARDIQTAMTTGTIASFLQPLDKPVPMVSTEDIGQVAAELLQRDEAARRVVELEGPHRVTPAEVAIALSKLLARPVRAEAVPRQAWADLFRSQGASNPDPRIRMLDGFNEGWIEFDSGESAIRKGSITIDQALKRLMQRISQ
ncbi:NAD(P)H dehydrogenase (quinone) [Caballeronia udeis]|uniref:NAD(P)H dehydrogenase (Quinone) n=1 Tax=Caballeronia udeis TaxID=1232866 RepID=A0ABW8MQW2_9BURK